MSKEKNKILETLRLTYCNDNEIALDEIKNNKLREQQLETLKNNIIHSKNSDIIDVYDFEPTWGKTTEVRDILPEYKRINPNKRVLWVTERKKDCEELERDINKMFKKTDIKAKAIVGHSSAEQREKILEKYDIVIVTHERYRRLSRLYNQEKKVFQDNRHLLIIDEKLDMCKTINFSIGKSWVLRNKIEKIAGTTGADLYDKLVFELLEIIGKQNKKTIQNKGIVFETTSNLQEMSAIVEHLTNNILILINATKEYKNFDYDEVDKQTIIEQIEDLREFYTDTSIIAEFVENEVVLKVPNNSIKMWNLEYNLILDATASIDKTYCYDKEKFNIIHQERIYNHKYWKFLWANVNSTTYGRNKKYSNYEEVIADIMSKFLDVNNTLVVGKKIDETETVSQIAKKYGVILMLINHYGNLNGSNEYRDCKNFLNLDLNYIQDSVYVLRYLYYSKKKINNWTTSKGRFTNQEIDEFKTMEIVKSHCQAIKRINRDMKYHSIVLFLSHREDIANKVCNYLGIEDFIHCLEIERLFKKEKLSLIENFLNLCNEIVNGNIPEELKQLLNIEEFKKYSTCLDTLKIPKCIIAELIGCSSKTSQGKSNSFGTNILKDEMVKQELETLGIEINHTTVNFNTNKKS